MNKIYKNKNLWQLILSFSFKKAAIHEPMTEKLNSTFGSNSKFNSKSIKKNLKLFKTHVLQLFYYLLSLTI